MKKLSLNFLFPLLALILLVIVFNRKVFTVPPLGHLLNPFRGVIQNEKSHNTDLQLNLGSKAPINIIFDERSVPHIFASDQEDLYFAQGYVSASDRLWQMDFLSYASAGRLSEILGKDFLDHDRRQRRCGMLSSSIKALHFIEANSETKTALDNYTRGVNKYISQLSEADMPLEYKLMDYRPEPWTNLKSVLILKYMAALLSGYQEDHFSSYMYMALGKTEFNKLYSSYLIDETKNKFSILHTKDSCMFNNSHINFSFLESSPQYSDSIFKPAYESNNWAIAPGKSKSGAAILSNDPHLNLSFPAIWYELQLHSKDMNVYGYSIPGTPGVIIGYNENISWGLTSGASDVYDFFKLELNKDYSKYKFDETWRNTEKIVEEIKVRNESSFYDTVFYTIHGPIESDFRFGPKEKKGMASKWTLHDPSNEFLSFIKLNKASNYTDFSEAIKHYKCPVQNFIYADVNGNIALHHQGKILKDQWNNKGKFILDGTRSDHLSKEMEDKELPFVHNPEQGFVFSANNNPFQLNSPNDGGYYFELRANKIKHYLMRPGKFSVKDMELMQLDNTNRLAELSLPILLDLISDTTSKYVKEFRKWGCVCNKESEIALVFEQWWAIIESNTWDEITRFKMPIRLPDDLILLDLISNDPNNKYFDKQGTDKIETAKDIIQLSLDQLTKPSSNWGDFNKINIMHLLNIPIFSINGAPVSGHPNNALNASSGNWGPSLRFVVEMTKKPQGYGVYAGGQSGNPASKEYASFIDDWLSGKYYKHNFFSSKLEGKQHTAYEWTINR